MDEVPEDSLIYSDTERLSLILKNLIANSIDYADAKKERQFCKITFSQRGKQAIIQVADNGIGIPEEYNEKIWEMFFRGKTSMSSGLGLYMVKQMTEIIKGDIQVESEVGKGTTVTIAFPSQNLESQAKQQVLSVA